jgi:hypothetical protein
MAQFALQFAPARIKELADAYSYPGEPAIVELGVSCQKRGYLTRTELLTLGRWKSPRTVPRLERNDHGVVEEATRIALTAASEQLRIGAPRALHGVDWAVASVILHFCHRDRYPILDFRAFESLGIAPMPRITFDLWWEYVQCCRTLADRHGVDMRTLDRALWQYSKKPGD